MIGFVKAAVTFICANLRKPIRRKRHDLLTHTSLIHPQYISIWGRLLFPLVKTLEVFVLDTMRYEKERTFLALLRKDSVDVCVRIISSYACSDVCRGWAIEKTNRSDGKFPLVVRTHRGSVLFSLVHI